MLWFDWIFRDGPRSVETAADHAIVCVDFSATRATKRFERVCGSVGGYIRDGGRANSNQQPKQARKRRMTKSAESSQKDATKKLEKLYAQTLALRALRWKTAKGMAPIITRMRADAKAFVALKAELTAGVAAIWDDGAMEQHECTTRMEPRGTFNDQLDSVGEIEVAGLEDIEESLGEIAAEVMEVAEAAEEPKLHDEPEALKDYRCPSVEEEEGGADGRLCSVEK